MRTEANGTPVVVERTWEGLRAAFAGPCVLVTDRNVEGSWGPRVRQELGDSRATIVLEPGEAHKTVAAWASCVEHLVSAGIDRGTVVVALGGGVVGDLAGFAAATTLRGLSWVALPTTLLAMVDAAIGGKTGVNLPAGKNLVGAFHSPLLVWSATEALSTLPADEWANGWAEVVKTALVGDAALFDGLTGAHPTDVVERCARVKAHIVTEDPTESGVRVVLNLGHTVGHAIETASEGRFPHGSAVAIGLVAEARWAVRLGVCPDPHLPERIARHLRDKGLPTELPALENDRMLAAMRVDKKGTGDKIRVPLPERPGKVQVVELPRSELVSLLQVG